MTQEPINLSDIVFPIDSSQIVAEGNVILDGNDTKKIGIATFSIDLKAHIFINVQLDFSSWLLLQAANNFHEVVVGEIKFPRCSVYNSGISISPEGVSSNNVTFSTNYSEEITDIVSEISFPCINAPNWIGDSVVYGEKVINCRISLVFGAYEVDLDSIIDNNEEQRKTLGYSITAVGRIRRVDRAEFSSDDAEVKRIIDAIMWGLNFATGHWPFIPMFRYHKETEGKLIQYSISRHMAYDWGQTWHSPVYPEALKEVVSGLFVKLNNLTWKQPIRELINWYSDSISQNGTSVGSLIWLQTGLEMLAWTYLTQDPATLSMTESDFDTDVTRSASQKISVLLDVVNVNKTIPPRYQGLLQFSGSLSAARAAGTIRVAPSDPLDGPSVITHVRNVFVHPKQSNKRPILPEDAQFEAKYLALDYLETSILKVLNVNAPVVRRTSGSGTRSANSVEPLPWVASPSHIP